MISIGISIGHESVACEDYRVDINFRLTSAGVARPQGLSYFRSGLCKDIKYAT